MKLVCVLAFALVEDMDGTIQMLVHLYFRLEKAYPIFIRQYLKELPFMTYGIIRSNSFLLPMGRKAFIDF